MGLFSFGKKVKLYAPVDGQLAEHDTGFTIVPERHHVYSPVSGKISALAPEQRAIHLTSGKLQITLHLGETDAEPAFYVHEGDEVTPETPLAFVDQPEIEKTRVKVAVDNAATHAKKIDLSTSGQVSHDQEVATVTAR
ncbi:PTS glucose transporter subunit IIA [Lactiplantibacillus modestisalitolerans]|uniref:PTS glucose transporter subunit IIA n=1 Tax=Lactiplantibacillus modestisalitolerans TaxID=1457219 RepID=A0ABV5WRD4_9LACO|nr:PTS glucose transporter subunit IIA [Lactiplantibacillus modestisalitolerans]